MAIGIPDIKAMDMDNIRLPQEIRFANGVPVYLISDGTRDIVRIDILFSGGYAVQTKPLQALFTNRMLREGTERLNAAAVSRRIDSCGAWIETYSSQSCNHITLYSLKRHTRELLKLLAEIVKNPSFPVKNLDIVRNANKSHFLINSRKVDVVAQRYFERSLWGCEHPFGRLVSAEDYDCITTELLQEYYARVYGSANCTIFLSGNIDVKLIDDVAAYFGKDEWGASQLSEITDLSSYNTIYGRVNVPVEDTMQSAVKIGAMVMDSGHPDFYTFKYLTVLLGGFFGSRLMTNIREEKGYTYHIEADISAFGKHNALVITSETATGNVERLIDEVYNEMYRLHNEPVSSEEMYKLRNCTLGELCREYEGVIAKADVFINAWLSGESFEGVNDYLDIVRKTGTDEFISLARKYLLPEKMIEIVAG